MYANVRRSSGLALCLLAAACGSSPQSLLKEDSRLTWEASSIILAAEDLDDGLADAVYEAEAAKHEACEPIIGAAREQIYEGQGSFGERFLSDLTQVVSLIVPIRPIDRCARAQRAYKQQVSRLCQRLNARHISMRCPD